MGDILPTSERQARELTGLDPGVAAEVVERAAEDGPLTAASIREARAQWASKPRPPGHPARDVALDEFLDRDVDVTRARLRANVHKAAVAAGQLADFDAENVAAAVEDDFMETLAWTQRRINDWADAVQKARPRGLRIVKDELRAGETRWSP